ncbi:hypothetical protein [Spirosoma harenae]
MKKTVRPCAETMYGLTMLAGLLIGLSISGYYLANYPLAFADTIQKCLPSKNSLVRWLTTI